MRTARASLLVAVASSRLAVATVFLARHKVIIRWNICRTQDAPHDNKTVSKWARALRYASRSKEPAVWLRTFMKEAGGVNACADLYARYFERGRR
jgi:hypothetical protein